MDEKSLSPLFSVRGGGGGGQWLQMTGTLICVTFSLPLGVSGWLQYLLVTLPGLFCLLF